MRYKIQLVAGYFPDYMIKGERLLASALLIENITHLAQQIPATS